MSSVTLDLEEYEKMRRRLEFLEKGYKSVTEGFDDYFKRLDEKVVAEGQLYGSMSGQFGRSCSKCGSNHNDVRMVLGSPVSGMSVFLCRNCRQRFYFEKASSKFNSEVFKYVEEKK